MSRKGWLHWEWIGGGDPMTSFTSDSGPAFELTPFTERVSVLRTRLFLWVWWASNTYPQPGPSQGMYPLKAKIQYNKAESGDFPPPDGWPTDPGTDQPDWRQPVIYSTLHLAAQTYRPADHTAVLPQVFYGWAQLLPPETDSAAQRRLDGTFVITPWLAISGGTADWGDSYPGGATPIPFNFAARLSTLMEVDG